MSTPPPAFRALVETIPLEEDASFVAHAGDRGRISSRAGSVEVGTTVLSVTAIDKLNATIFPPDQLRILHETGLVQYDFALPGMQGTLTALASASPDDRWLEIRRRNTKPEAPPPAPAIDELPDLGSNDLVDLKNNDLVDLRSLDFPPRGADDDAAALTVSEDLFNKPAPVAWDRTRGQAVERPASSSRVVRIGIPVAVGLVAVWLGVRYFLATPVSSAVQTAAPQSAPPAHTASSSAQANAAPPASPAAVSASTAITPPPQQAAPSPAPAPVQHATSPAQSAAPPVQTKASGTPATPPPAPTTASTQTAASSAKPAAPSAQPAAPTAKPATPPAQPGTPPAQPAAPVSQPAAPAAKPTASTAQPAPATTPPSASSAKPPVSSAKPPAASGQPPAATGQPAAVPAPAQAVRFQEPSRSGYVVQVAAVPTKDEADRLVTRLVSQGYPAYAVRGEGAAANLYRVRVGGYPDRDAAQQVAKQLEASEGFKPWIAK